jgi:hypothetical protein
VTPPDKAAPDPPMPGTPAFSSVPATGNQIPAAGQHPANPRAGARQETPMPGESIGSVERLMFFAKFEDFMFWFEPIVERFPAYERTVLCARIKNLMYGMFEKIIRTNNMKNKLPGWYDLDIDLKILKRYVTRSRKKGSKYLGKKSHETAVKKLVEIGNLLGGLIRKG